MKPLQAMFAALTAAAAGCACAQATLSYTDAAPYTDIAVPARTSAAGAPIFWQGQLTRSDVQAAMRQARTEGTIATGEAMDYPYPAKASAASALAAARQAPVQVLGGPPGDGLTVDGYRFAGGEIGYAYVGHRKQAP